MKNTIKLLTLAALTILGLTSQAQQVITATSPTTNGVFLISTNRASVYQIEVTSTASGLLSFYDMDTIASPQYGTNYTNAVFSTRVTYPTNYVTSFVGYNGYTNWYTNAGLWTLSVTNAANTNALTPLVSTIVSPNTYIVQNVDALFIRGITCYSTCTNASIVINYRSGR